MGERKEKILRTGGCRAIGGVASSHAPAARDNCISHPISDQYDVIVIDSHLYVLHINASFHVNDEP